MTFELLNVKPEIIKALKEQGIESPTLIQKKSIPPIKSGKDVIGMSKTGSGKTASFGIPILEKIKPKQGLQVLILAPVRELAVQIANELNKFGKYIQCNITTVYGGVALEPQIRNMARSEIIVATPGRLLDHLERGNVDLSNISCFVLDEADKMVEMGFIEDITKILNCTPKGRQIVLFGATISNEIEHIKRTHMNEPFVAKADVHIKDDFLEQYYYNIKPYEKFSLLVHLLNKEKTKRTIIFCSSRATVEIVSKNLRNQNIKSEMIHGKLTQNKRLKVIGDFNGGKVDILIASAVAARGLDIKDVTHIFNYDLSRDPQEYIHRVGRTARAGEKGKAITLLSEKDYDVFSEILSRYPIKVNVLPNENFPRISFDSRPPAPARGRFNRGGPRQGGNRFGKSRRPRQGFGVRRR